MDEIYLKKINKLIQENIKACKEKGLKPPYITDISEVLDSKTKKEVIEDIIVESETIGTIYKKLIPTIENDTNGDIENIYFHIVLIVYYDNSLEVLTEEEYDKHWKEYNVCTDILAIKEVKIYI